MRKFLSWCRGLLIPYGHSKSRIAKDMGVTMALLLAAIMFCMVLTSGGHSDTAVPLVFVLAVLLTARFTDGYFFGMLASCISVIAVNYAFTYPYFEFNFTITGYPFTFLTMFTVSMVVGMLTEQNKRKSRVEAEAEREKMKANLLRSVSHDLRTPLTAIIGSTNAVLENYDEFSDEVKKDLILHVRDGAQWLVRLVENILSITRIKDGVVKIKKCPEAVEEIVGEVLSKFRKNRDIPVHVKVPDDLLMVPMDATLIEQVLLNLMENVDIHAKGATAILVSVEQCGKEACFSVTDDGAGIDEDILPKLFEELFPHAKEINSDRRRSMGIGLSACMSVVRAHGGTMRAENLPHGGAKVSFVLPMEEET